MSDMPADITLERLARLSTAVADLMEGTNRQGRDTMRALSGISARLDRVDERLGSIEREVRDLASEQALLGNRVEEAFSRALRLNIRMDEMDDRHGGKLA